MAKIITVTSGKGGVGKTGLCVSLAIYLAEKGFRTCLFDADLGLANINILLNLYPEYNLSDVILRNTSIEQILLKDVYGIDIIPGSSGVEQMADLSRDQIHFLIQSFAKLDDYDFIIFDTSAGTSQNVISFCMACQDLILVIIPEPTSLTDAYALLKILSMNGYAGNPKIVVNQSKRKDMGKKIFDKFSQTVTKYLAMDIALLGTIIKDPHVPDAVTQQKPVLSIYPDCKASKSIRSIGENLVNQLTGKTDSGSLETFFTRYVRFLNRPIKRTAEKKESPIRHIEKQEEVNSLKPVDDKPPLSETDILPVSSKKELETADVEAPLIEPGIQTAKIQGNETALLSETSTKEKTQINLESLDSSTMDVKSMLTRLIDTMSSVSEEIKALRIVAENQIGGGNGQKPSTIRPVESKPPVKNLSNPGTDYLDFESYRNQRKKSE